MTTDAIAHTLCVLSIRTNQHLSAPLLKYWFRSTLPQLLRKILFRINAMRRIVRACVNATWFFQVRAEIARGRLLFDSGFHAAGPFGILGHHFKRMKDNVPIRAVARAEAARNGPVADVH